MNEIGYTLKEENVLMEFIVLDLILEILLPAFLIVNPDSVVVKTLFVFNFVSESIDITSSR